MRTMKAVAIHQAGGRAATGVGPVEEMR